MASKKQSSGLFCVGTSPVRKDAAAKARGEAAYVDDYTYGNMLYARAVRSPRPHIRIQGLDFSCAEKVPGYVTGVTFRDIPGKRMWPLVQEDYPFLPENEARFAGETVAIVVAETPEAAHEAALKVKISFKELPYIDDQLKSLSKNAPRLHGKDNIYSKYVIKRGDVDKAFKNSEIVVEGFFRTNYHVHVYLETQGAIACPEQDGGMTVYSSTQCPFYVLDAVSAVLGVGHNRVRVVQRTTGGGFGGKEDVPALVASHAAIAARKTGRPVKLIYDREEDFLSMSKRHPSWVHVKYGAKKDGTLTACRVRYVMDGGAYVTLSPIVLWRGTVHAAGPYKIPVVDVEGMAVATNRVPCGAYRGFGQPQVSFAGESLIDELAGKLGMDPIEFRLKNILRDGDRSVTGQVMSECGLETALQTARRNSGWDKKRKTAPGTGPVRTGLGVAINYYGVGLGAKGEYLDRAAAQVLVEKDGSVLVSIGNTEMGQGAFTVISQICAETLNAPYKDVRVGEIDTFIVPDSGPTVASRTTLMSGNAVMDACSHLRERIFGSARELLDAKCAKGEMLASGGVFSSGRHSVTFGEAVTQCWKQRLKMCEQGWYASPKTTFNLETGQGDPYSTYAYSANIAEVDVDTETGVVTLKKLTSAHDAGTIINPLQAEGQANGGALQAVGYALYENLVYRDGVMVNPNLADYVIPSTREVPEYNVEFVTKGYHNGPYKARGFGETPLISPAAAIANAVKDASGARVCRLPMLPELVLKEIKEPGHSKAEEKKDL